MASKLRAEIEAVLIDEHNDARDHGRDSVLRRKTAAVDAMVDSETTRAVARVKR